MADDLVAFVAARLDEDEAVSCEMHEARVCSSCFDTGNEGFRPDLCDCGYPARVLREVQASRAVLDEYLASARALGEGLSRTRRKLVLSLAAVWSDHPDYRQEWAPAPATLSP